MSLALLACRMHLADNATYRFLSWNLFLAAIPFVIGLVAAIPANRRVARFSIWPLCFIWLVFYPNSPYLITDLIHLRQRFGVPLWYDAILLFSFAFSGLCFGLISLRIIQSVLSQLYNSRVAWAFATLSLVLGGVGVYIGRFLRFNSWDLLYRSHEIFETVLQHFFDPVLQIRAIGMSILIAGLSTAAYFALCCLQFGHERRPAEIGTDAFSDA